MTAEQLARVRWFSGEIDPKECACDHKLQGTGAVFYQSTGLLQCSTCRGWQPIRRPIQ